MRPADTIVALDSYHTVARGPRRCTDFQTQCADFGGVGGGGDRGTTNWCLSSALRFAAQTQLGSLDFGLLIGSSDVYYQDWLA
jgi:hypothetical protein